MYPKNKPFLHVFGRGFTANVFVIDQGDELWMVDVGISIMGRPHQIIKAMEKDGLNPKKISKLFITHAHPDHANAVAFFSQNYACEVWMHEIEVARFDGGDRFFWEDQIEGARGLIREFFPVSIWFAKFIVKYTMGSIPHLPLKKTLKGDELFKGKIYDLQVIYTPGHTPGHCCYFIPQISALFCGDLIDPSFDHKASLNFSTSNYSQIYSSIEKILSLKIELFCSAHGHFINTGIENNRELCSGTLQNLDSARERTIELLKLSQQEGMRISDFNGKFPKKTWMLQDQMCVPYSIIKELEKEGKVRFENQRFYYNGWL
jgi:glyoxylase-like metal-dependent hydrolase (beta-lactamase superfamily II)